MKTGIANCWPCLLLMQKLQCGKRVQFFMNAGKRQEGRAILKEVGHKLPFHELISRRR